jgi:hypothetical protein
MEELFNIVFQIVLKNNPEMIVRAHAINTKDMLAAPKNIRVNLYKSDFTDENRPEGMNHSTVQDCLVIACDFYRMNDPFLVQLPNGMTKWVSENTRGI